MDPWNVIKMYENISEIQGFHGVAMKMLTVVTLCSLEGQIS
jgi:hypothetical protein